MGLGSNFCPLFVICVTLGKSPTASSLLCHVYNRRQSCCPRYPVPLFALVQLYGVRPSSHVCGNGEVLPPIFLHSSQRISPWRSSLSISFIFFKNYPSIDKMLVFLGISRWGLCPLAVRPLAGVSCHTLHVYGSPGFPHFLSPTTPWLLYITGLIYTPKGL